MSLSPLSCIVLCTAHLLFNFIAPGITPGLEYRHRLARTRHSTDLWCVYNGIMTDFEDEQSPLLGSEPERDAPVTATGGTKALTVETTPLLADGSNGPSLRYNDSPRSNDAASHITQASGSDRASIHFNKKPGKRWPSIVAILVLALAALSTVVLAYFVPAAVEEYAKQGVVIEPTNLSLESITTDGVRARIQANFRLDGSRVKNEQVRRIGQTATWIVRKLGTEQTIVSVYLPEFSNVLLGSAQIPPLIIDLVDGHTTTIDFVADLVPGDAEGIRSIANQWLDGRLGSVRLRGKADIALKTGFIPLGTHTVSESLVFEGQYLYRSFASLYFGEKFIM